MKRDIFLMVIATVIIIILFHFYNIAYLPASYDATTQTIIIPEGMGLKSIAYHLKAKGVIRSAKMFYMLGRLHKMEALKAGEYSLNPMMSPLEILEIINSAQVVLRKVTIAEGLNIFQIAGLLEEKGMAERTKFLQYCFDQNHIKSLGINADSLEGYLFPETYFFCKGISEKTIINSMVNQFFKVFDSDMVERRKELGMSLHEIVTLASLIEKETGLPDERPFISAVFHNRLKEGIPLQCDPTVIYGIKSFNGNLTKRDLQIKTPYNTYTKRGLPKGPIANPGLLSLRAALYPADVRYRYFVSKNDGSHVFSETLKEHNRAVYKFQKKDTKRF